MELDRQTAGWVQWDFALAPTEMQYIPYIQCVREQIVYRDREKSGYF